MGNLNAMYDQVVQVRVPNDTSVAGLTVQIDSFQLDYINDLPPGLSYNCDDPNCTWAGGSNGCVRIFGTPTGTVQNYQLGIGIVAFLEIIGTVPQELNQYSIYIDHPVFRGRKYGCFYEYVSEPDSRCIERGAGKSFRTRIQWTLIDLSGRIIRSGNFEYSPGIVKKLWLNSPANGLYLIQIRTDRGALTRRVTVHE